MRFKHLLFFFFFLSFVLTGLHLRHMEVPRLGVSMELLAYSTAITTRNPSCVSDLHHSSQQCWIHNPLSEARDRTRNLMAPSRIRFRCATTGTPKRLLLIDEEMISQVRKGLPRPRGWQGAGAQGLWPPCYSALPWRGASLRKPDTNHLRVLTFI